MSFLIFNLADLRVRIVQMQTRFRLQVKLSLVNPSMYVQLHHGVASWLRFTMPQILAFVIVAA
jgi:hypothetical protein